MRVPEKMSPSWAAMGLSGPLRVTSMSLHFHLSDVGLDFVGGRNDDDEEKKQNKSVRLAILTTRNKLKN